MKKINILLLAAAVTFLISPLDLSAESRYRGPEKHYLTMTCLVNPLGLGYQHHLKKGIYATAGIDYLGSERDLQVRAGAALEFPIKVLIFRFYGGGGMQFSRDQGYQYPFVNVGTRFLFFYSELIHPWKKDMSPEYRFGFSFSF